MDAVQYQMEVLSGEIVRLDEVISKIEEAVPTGSRKLLNYRRTGVRG